MNLEKTKAFPKPNGPQHGMDLRDWFAGQALSGLLANHKAVEICTKKGDEVYRLSETAYEYADDMMRARGSKR